MLNDLTALLLSLLNNRPEIYGCGVRPIAQGVRRNAQLSSRNNER